MVLLRRATFWVALIGIAATVMLVLRLHAQLVEAAPPPPIAPPTKPFARAVAASGLVEARNENTNIGVPVAGLLTQVHVRVWDRVKKGDVLLSLDDRELRADLISERAQVAVAAATVARVQDQLSRMESVQDPRAVSEDDLKTRRGDVAVAQAQRAAAEAAVEQTQALLDRLTVRAPIDGTILQVNNRAGEYVVPGAATPPLVLGNIDEIQVRADVDEQIAPRVRAGRDAIGFLKGETKNPIPMTFVRIEPFVIPKVSLTGSSEERVDTRVLQVIFRFTNPGQAPIYVGQQMDIYINDGPAAP
jgi:RND family efflux transporter MFP subunit